MQIHAMSSARPFASAITRRLGIGIVINALHVAHDGVLPKFIPVGLPDLLLEQRLPLLPTRYDLRGAQPPPAMANGSDGIFRHGVKKIRGNEFEHDSRQSLCLRSPPISWPGPREVLLKKHGCSPHHFEIRMGVELPTDRYADHHG